jgi:acyl-CoA hydrolase
MMTVAPTRLIDMVFPGDANHHGTLFGGVALAHMDKVAFIAASRHGHVGFVTASCERIDFTAPAHIGEMVEFTGEVVRVGRRSLGVQVDMVAEGLLTGERRLCTRGLFNMVAVKPEGGWPGDFQLPALHAAAAEEDGVIRMVELVLPDQTDHNGSLFGGAALSAMGKAAFIAATRHARAAVVMAASHQIDFESPIRQGETMELCARVRRVGRSSMTVEVQLWAEALMTGERRRSATAGFVMVALGPDQRPTRVPPLP